MRCLWVRAQYGADVTRKRRMFQTIVLRAHCRDVDLRLFGLHSVLGPLAPSQNAPLTCASLIERNCPCRLGDPAP